MVERYISLLYPDEGAYLREATRQVPVATESVCQALGLTDLLGLKNGSPANYLTDSPDVILYRQKTFADVLAHKEAEDTLTALLPILWDIAELRNLCREAEDTSGESYLYSITEIELYVAIVTTLYEGFSPIAYNLESLALKNLLQFVTELVESEQYKELKEQLKKLSSRMLDVRSITVGVNVDGQFRPYEAGVISVNAEPFHSGTTLDKILRMSFKNDARTCIAALTPFGKGQSDNRKEALLGAFNSAILDVFRSSVRGWRNVVSGYVLDNTSFLLRMLPEIEFVCRGVALQRRMIEK